MGLSDGRMVVPVDRSDGREDDRIHLDARLRLNLQIPTFLRPFELSTLYLHGGDKCAYFVLVLAGVGQDVLVEDTL